MAAVVSNKNVLTTSTAENLSQSSKKVRIKKKITELLLCVSVKGISNIIRSDNLFVIIVWIIFILLSTAVGFNYVIKSIIDYLRYNTVTTIDVINERSVQFPTISFCVSPPLDSIQINKTILKLKFDRVELSNYSHFFEEFIDPVYNKCFRFNSGKNMFKQTVALLNSTTRGKQNGARLEMYFDVPFGYDYVELLANIHNHSSPPYDLSASGGYWIRPGCLFKF